MAKKSSPSTPILPGGTVTFLFTDIEGSTQLLDQLRDQYATLLDGHHQIIREALEQWHGREVDTQGDAFFAAFPKATEAVAAVAHLTALACLAVLLYQADARWPAMVAYGITIALFLLMYLPAIPVGRRFFPISTLAGVAGAVAPLLA